MEILKSIAVQNLEKVKNDPNVVGELLRAWAFVGEGYGCYSNFDLQPEFVKVEVTPREFGMLWGRPFDPTDIDPDGSWGYCDTEAIKEISWFKHPNGIEVGWYWDGDGSLAFYSPELVADDCDGSLMNSDCKHNNEWSFNEPAPPQSMRKGR